MKKILSVVFYILVGIVLAYSQSGIWTGDLEVQGIKMPIVFHLDDDKPVMDSPAQGVKGIPIQIINGTKDTQVFYQNNLAALNNGLPSNDSNKIMSMENLNHLFQHCKTGSSLEYSTI